ncbi:DnaD domain protein [Oceanirhabdus sp. W0125-5]|uniref:DnaD domain protein n=1 Tax=Oceanirhabdus sp. W0125-5 TaxID=2999116 RepID=UPI0022F2F067|nr:DnaD domain protein [Oceanirhabdus sp. W0125-5]WBW97640.1 DnaD domain protein [Oceanirhabdus sp. W0125-5]
MSTFMLGSKQLNYTIVSNIFIDKYMADARGEYIKVYLLGLKYCQSGELGATSNIISSSLNLLETDVLNAWKYWHEKGIINLTPIDSNDNYKVEFLDLSNCNVSEVDQSVNLLHELDNSSVKSMFFEIEAFIGRPLSSKEMTTYLGWQKEFNFSPELILLLIQYSVSKGKTDFRYIEKIAIAWHDAKISSISDAQQFIRQNEDKRITMRKILKYLGLSSDSIAKPQEQILEKWITVYNFPIEIIYKACDICFERLNKAELKYIDAILNSWFKNNVKTLQDIERVNKKSFKATSTRKTKGSFGDFEQRNYDFKELEKKLLGWSNDD